ncbi:hypothetical protein BD324DRAFT_633122 [Kockovaella imperatae]|uniref:Uncharacterized protein n=1 Tax=Kockovaella imperatae TaxID=4999 RepID=A0A1Y1UA27_9TREE|nr:hypothetical protein BD324DRAFT_633122 [Kockovaella imperatae]ORX34901.1 hypothetical protein BD324DRAFT_633122 [Kockovaella imperatae]
MSLRTPRSSPMERDRPTSSLGFRSLFRSLGPSVGKSAGSQTLDRLRSATPIFHTPLKRSSTRPSVHFRPSPTSKYDVSSPTTRIPVPARPVTPAQLAISTVEDRRDPKWKHIEADWQRQANFLKIPHRNCLLGAVCLDIRDPLDFSASFYLEYVRDRPIRLPRPEISSSVAPATTPEAVSHSPESPLATFPHRSIIQTWTTQGTSTLRSRQILDRPRPIKRRCQTPDPDLFRDTSFPVSSANTVQAITSSRHVRRRTQSAPHFSQRIFGIPRPKRDNILGSPWSIVGPATPIDTDSEGWHTWDVVPHPQRPVSPPSDRPLGPRLERLRRMGLP